MEERDEELKQQLLLLFTSSLQKITKLESETMRWGTNSLWIPPNYVERNLLFVLSRGDRPYFRNFIESKRLVEPLRGNYAESWDLDHFVELQESKIKRCNVLWLHQNATDLADVFGRYKRFVDLVFTDPPYLGEKEAVYYYELATVYNSWLSLYPGFSKYGSADWWRSEITDDPRQGKDREIYFQSLRKALEAVQSHHN